MNRKIFVILPFVLLVFASKSGYTASFDCAKAGTVIERLVCSNNQLSKLDEQYGKLYQLALEKTAGDPVTHKLVRSLAKKALVERNQRCSNRRCLEKWYYAGKDRLSQRLWSTDPTWFKKKLTGRLLYERLNVRSFKSMLGPRLSSVEYNYLSDFYPKVSSGIYPKKLTISHEGERWTIDVTGDHTIAVRNSIAGASYRTDEVHYVYFDPISNELRVGMPSHCNFISQGSSPNFTSRITNEGDSHGEIEFNEVLPRSGAEVFDSPNGNRVAMMYFSVEDVSPENSPEPYYRRKIRFCNSSYETYIEPSYQVRMKHDVRVLYFGKQGSWLNLSADPLAPAWIHRAKLPIKNSTKVKSREEVMSEGTSIVVKSNHRLRKHPTTESEILHLLQPGDRGLQAIIEPLQVVGDWMRVVYTSPNPYLVSYDPNDSTAIEPKVIEGWLKWRKRPGREYVNIFYKTLGH